MNFSSIQQKLDVVAVFLSGLCAIHCFLTPVFLVIFPFVTTTTSCCEHGCQNDGFHEMMAYIVLPLSSFSFLLGCKRHFKKSIVITGTLGIAMIVFAAFWGQSMLGGTGERWVTTGGGIILAVAHIRNFLLCHASDHQCCKKEEELKLQLT